jgi:hypothetical protein
MSLSHVSVPCLPVMYPFLSLCSLSPVLCPLSHVSISCLPSSVPCLKCSVRYPPSFFRRPLTPINCPSVPFSVALFHCSRPLFFFFPSTVLLRLLSSDSCLPYLRECSEFFLVIYMQTLINGALDGWLRAESGLIYTYYVERSSDRLAIMASWSCMWLFKSGEWLVGYGKELRDVWLLGEWVENDLLYIARSSEMAGDVPEWLVEVVFCSDLAIYERRMAGWIW